MKHYRLFRLKVTAIVIVLFITQFGSKAQTWPPVGMIGNGQTDATAFQIGTVDHLEALADFVNAGYGDQTAGVFYKLVDDLDLGGFDNGDGKGWKPIGDNSSSTMFTQFHGNFDGAGHVIKNLTINRNGSSDFYIGLFGYLSEADIQNLGVENCNITGYSNVGGLVGSSSCTNITKCYATGSVNGQYTVGGLAGSSGLSGVYYNGITNCYAACNVIANNQAGGLVGAAAVSLNMSPNGTHTITNCYATGNVSGNSYLGGLVGSLGAAGTGMSIVTNSYATGTVSGTNYLGGLVGQQNTYYNGITDCVSANISVNANTVTPYVDRIVGSVISSAQNHNYGNQAMAVKNNSVPLSISPGLNTAAGADVAMSDMKTAIFYSFSGNWDSNAWDIDANSASQTWTIWEGNSLPYFPWQSAPAHILSANISEVAFILKNPVDCVVIEILRGGITVETLRSTSLPAGNNPLQWSSFATTVQVGDIVTLTVCETGRASSYPVEQEVGVFSGGDGTSAATAWQINAAEQLAFLADYVNAGNGNQTAGVYYQLMNDLDLNGYTNWAPIGKWTGTMGFPNAFQGFFNGNNFTIHNLTINRTTEDNIGLFGYVYNGSIQNLGVVDCNIQGMNATGSLAGTVDNASITNIFATGSVDGELYVGGLVGQLYSSTTTNCYATGNVNGDNFVGGLVGINDNSAISNCYATGNVTATSGSDAGGIAGGQVGAVGITNSYCYENALINGSAQKDITPDVIHGESISATDLLTQSTYSGNGWTFDSNNWKWDAAENYPKLNIGATTYPFPFYFITYHLNGGAQQAGYWDFYDTGAGLVLPVPTRTDYLFDGWYGNAALTGSAIASVSSSDSGHKAFWAKWISTATPPPPVNPPHIAGYVSMTLTVGYTATSSAAFTITGTAPVTVAKVSGNDLIAWNNTTKKLDIAEGLTAGVYEVKLTASNNVSTYTLIFTLTVEKPSYYLDIAGTFPGGTVTVSTAHANPYLAEEGSTATLTVTPDAGYKLEELTVYMLDNAGGTVTSVVIPLTDKGNGTFTFIMPGHHITIEATFSLTTGVETLHATSLLKAYAQNGVLHVSGLSAGQDWCVYNILGKLIYQGVDDGGGNATLPLPARGVYIVTNGKTTIKVVN